jgi:hypothetical protein
MESSRNDAGAKMASAMPRSNVCCPVRVRLFLSGFSMMTLDADEVWQQPGSSPARDDAEKHLGQRERRDRAVDRAVVGVQPDFNAAAEGETVDKHKARHPEGGQPSEDGVSELGERAGRIMVGDLAHLRQVGTGGEDKRLAGDREPGDLAPRRASGLFVEDVAELEQSCGPKCRRPGVVASVVEGQQGQRFAAGEGDVAHVTMGHNLPFGERPEFIELCDGHRDRFFPVKWGFSQMTEPPWPSPMHIAVSP